MPLAPEGNAIYWIFAGLLLLGIEMLTGTFVVLFFACGAFLTALMTWLKVFDSLSWQLVFFALVSGAALFLFWKKLRLGFSGSKAELTTDVGNSVTLDADVAAGAQTEVQYQGARWTALNESGRDLTKGTSVKVTRVDGLTLILK